MIPLPPNPSARRIDIRDAAGTLRIRIKTDDFTSAPWPAWPGSTSPSRIDLIEELRRLKEEVLALRAEVDALTATP